jgi:hypothetical protein
MEQGSLAQLGSTTEVEATDTFTQDVHQRPSERRGDGESETAVTLALWPLNPAAIPSESRWCRTSRRQQ